MLKLIKISLYISIIPAIFLFGCSSGEYEIEKYEVNYTEKTVKVDSLRKITIKDDNDPIKEEKKDNKDNIKDNTKDSYYYVVQIGAFVIKENFDRFYERAKMTLGDDVYYEQSGNLYKIRIGNFTNGAEAIKLMEQVKSKGYFDAFVITRKK